jgi:hypothetical protein
MEIIRCEFVEGRGFDVDVTPYRDYFHRNKHRFPVNAGKFAGAAWHYDFSDPRCPHGAWCAAIRMKTPVEEIGTDRYQGGEVQVRLLTPNLVGYLVLTYFRIRSHSFVLYSPMPEEETSSYSDLIIDEVRLTEGGKVVYEVQFATGHWLIECADILGDWKPIAPDSESLGPQ